MTRKVATVRTALLGGVVAALIGQAAMATDTVVAYGDDAVRQARAREAEFQAQMSENARTVSRAIRANLEREVMRIRPPRVRLALSDAATRG